jgi:DtxR family Mn-dependent transcriptional regulator
MTDWNALIVGSVLILLFAILFWPERGLYFRWQSRRRPDSRETIEDALMHVHQHQQERRSATTESLADGLGISIKNASKLVQRMEARGLLSVSQDDVRLTGAGHRWALQVVRAHRLFERYLADETDVPIEEIHQHAHRLEHKLSPQELDKLDADMGYPAFDPHGDPIPTADGVLEVVESQPLMDWPAEKRAQIVHIEDEPPQVFAQIMAEGLRPGMILSVLESTPSRIVLEANETEHVLAPVVAANIAVREAPQAVPAPTVAKLTTLKIGQQARVTGLDDACQGLTRRRFLDLGITPGVLIEPVMQSGFGEPTAYRVRDTLIALRQEQSDLILIDRNGDKR